MAGDGAVVVDHGWDLEKWLVDDGLPFEKRHSTEQGTKPPQRSWCASLKAMH